MQHADFRFLAILVTTSLAPLPAFSQKISGDIIGQVYETSGAVIPGATVALRNVDTGRELNSMSSGDGSYSFPQLSPGLYELRVEHAGFQTKVVTDIRLSIDQRARLDVTLPIGEVSTTIKVEGGGAVLLQTETSELGQVVENRKIRELPLNGRSYVQLGAITPGVIGSNDNVPSDGQRFTARNNVSLFVAGQREIGVSYLVDGIETRNDSFGFVGIRPSIEMIEEFKLNRNAFGAEFGDDAAAVVNVSTKSGTNELHGTAYEFFRNDKLKARNFFDITNPPLHYNDFGASLGGPIMRNKLFFFSSGEMFRERRSSTLRGLFPSKAQLDGNLADNSAGSAVFPTSSSFCVANPRATQCGDVLDPNTKQPFPGNVIPASRISRFAKVYSQFVPETNNLSQAPLFNRIVTVAPTNDSDQYSLRIDHNMTSKDLVFYRYIHSDESQFVPGIMLYAGLTHPLAGQNFALGWTRSISPTLVNTFHGGYNRTGNFLFNEGGGPGGRDFATELFGLKNTPSNPNDFGLPRTSFTGFTTMGANTLPQGFRQQLFQFTDNLNYIRGKHTLVIGGEARRMRYFQFVDSNNVPRLDFRGNYTGSALGDFLLGLPLSASTALGDTTQNIRLSFFGLHVSDAYKVSSNLTLNLGLRWEYKSLPTEINNRQAVFDFSRRRILVAGKDIDPGIFQQDFKNFGPRVGFAYRLLGGKTVIRGGFGLFWAQGLQENDTTFLVLTPPFVQSLALTSGGTTPTLFADNLFPQVAASGPDANLFPFTMDRYMRRPYSPQWNLGVQRQFGANWALEASYMGNSSVRNGTFGNVNAGRVDPTGTIPLIQRVPYPQFSGILLAAGDGHGSYNAGTLSLTKRLSQGLSLLANYTWAKSIDDSSGEVNFTYRPAEGRKDMRGPSDFDINHRLVVSYVYDVPAGNGKQLLNKGGVVDAIVGGWQISGISTFQTGPVSTVNVPGDWAVRGPNLSTRPNCVINPNEDALRSNARGNGLVYFNKDAFQFPAPFTLGNCGRNVLRLPGLNNWDFSIHKFNKLTERMQLQTRFEFFNIWNHAQWSSVSTGMSSTTFGRVTAARPGRDIQIGMKLVF